MIMLHLLLLTALEMHFHSLLVLPRHLVHKNPNNANANANCRAILRRSMSICTDSFVINQAGAPFHPSRLKVSSPEFGDNRYSGDVEKVANLLQLASGVSGRPPRMVWYEEQEWRRD
jgi:hypothetical protein